MNHNGMVAIVSDHDYAVVITFPNNSTTFEALTKLRNEVGTELQTAVIVERDADGRLSIPDGVDPNAGVGVTGGSLVGMLVGVHAGPLGMLFGLAAGAAGGALVDAHRLDTGEDVITEFSRLVPPGGNAIIAQTDESSTTVLDDFVSAMGGSILRRPLDEVLDELEAQQYAAEEASRAAHEAIRQQKREERKEKFEERIEALKAKFHRD